MIPIGKCPTLPMKPSCSCLMGLACLKAMLWLTRLLNTTWTLSCVSEPFRYTRGLLCLKVTRLPGPWAMLN